MFAAIDEQLALVIAASAGLVTALGAIIIQLANLKVHVMENGVDAKAGATHTATSKGRTLGMVIEQLDARAKDMQKVVDANVTRLNDNTEHALRVSEKVDSLNDLVTSHIDSDEVQFQKINEKLDTL